MASAFICDFTGKELFYFLFKKKECPKCGEKMIKKKCSEIVDGARFKSASTPLYIDGRKVKHYYYLFTCKKCDAEFLLADLVK